MELIFRDFQPSDFDHFVEMVMGLYTKDGSKQTEMSPEKIAITVKKICGEDNPGKIVIFEKLSEPIGYCILNRFWSNEFTGEVLYIDELFVKKQFRSMGVGAAFFRFLESNPEKNVAAFMLEVTRTNQNGINFYQKIGFTEHHNLMLFKQLQK